MMRTLVAVMFCAALAFGLFGCGPARPELGGPCQSTCECDRTDAPMRCAGEWTCNAEKTCEYVCRNACSGQVYTCPDGTDCNGTFCSERTVLQCG